MQGSATALDDDGLAALFTAALAVRERAYAPYSRFAVGAALRDEHGAIHAGCNVENAAYPVGTCAEAGAIAAMVAAGGRRITAILVCAEGAGPVTPCGACRQRIREFAGPDVPVHAAGPGGPVMRATLGELLPFSFGPETLGSGPPRSPP
ncbi:cytidine deaminase [Methylobacterium aerolatum]|uniref:Cytidine deaminase n=1 Tax=Methylobacterium aerolatum TaxID=418708 RepID=A0ABU0I4X4_9HYPH|nr:cytidine deaminase [Methylobacterium aerolatum]MDQ0449673.1 cytidine deaminase [Methylobacterium aerolatum]GJD36039.1 Cytidine deaminase [Methylobacterium aerolatum]